MMLTHFILFFFPSGISCVDRKSSDLGLGGMRREYLQTDCAINAVILSISVVCMHVHVYLCFCVVST